MRSTRQAGWVAVLGLLLAGPAALAQVAVPPSKVVVFRVEPRGLELSEDQVVALSVYMAEVFQEKSRSQVVNWLEAVPLFAEGQDPKACLDRDCQGPLETKLGVDYGLYVLAVPLGKACVLTGIVYPAGGGQSTRTASVRGGCTGDELVTGLEALAGRLVASGPLLPLDPRARARSAFADLAAEEAGQGGAPVVGDGVPPPPAGAGAEPPPVGAEPPADLEPVVEGEPEEPSLMDDFPRFIFTLGASYSMAPLLTRDSDSRWEDGIKQPDQIGPKLILEARLGRYFTVGGHLAGLFGDRETRFVEAAGRFGFHIPLVWKLALYGNLGLGLSSWTLHKSCCQESIYPVNEEFEYVGFYANLGLGLRLMFFKHLGIHLELAGSVSPMSNRNHYYLYDTTWSDYQDDDIVLWRLELLLGLVTGF
jgi:hypothetical protein